MRKFRSFALSLFGKVRYTTIATNHT